MVPSWTETLLAAGVNVVGRTRYCVHPTGGVKSIAVVGGTKDLNLEKLLDVKPDLLILDREENPQAMTQNVPCPWIATHVTSINDVAPEILKIEAAIGCEQLRSLAERWQTVATRAPIELMNWRSIPGVLSWVREPAQAPTAVLYLIWKDPWMAIAPQTFIGSVLNHVGVPKTMHVTADSTDKYPVVDLEKVPEGTLLLCSSEPYPFAKKRQLIEALPFPAAIVDGEVFSWFGIRSLRFLEEPKMGSDRQP